MELVLNKTTRKWASISGEKSSGVRECSTPASSRQHGQSHLAQSRCLTWCQCSLSSLLGSPLPACSNHTWTGVPVLAWPYGSCVTGQVTSFLGALGHSPVNRDCGNACLVAGAIGLMR